MYLDIHIDQVTHVVKKIHALTYNVVHVANLDNLSLERDFFN